MEALLVRLSPGECCGVDGYLPPPAQAQAQPAQAQAQAHELPPPPRNPPELLLRVVCGMGFVRLVIPVVNEVKLPTTPAAIPVAPLIRFAAKSAPGILGIEDLALPEGWPVDAAGLLPVPTLPPIDWR